MRRPDAVPNLRSIGAVLDESHDVTNTAPSFCSELRNIAQLAAGRDVIYHPLHNGDTIRIMELHRGRFDDPLSCSFHYASLRNLHLEYDALSYVWAERTPFWVSDSYRHGFTASMECNGHSTAIGANLENALRHIRSPSSPLFLWADAICINQDDVLERGHQVGLMGSIYRNAKKVVFWIDENDAPGIWDEEVGEIKQEPRVTEDVRAQRAFGAICDIVNRWKAIGPAGEVAKYTVRLPFPPSSELEFSSFEEYPWVAQKFEDERLLRKILETVYHPRRRFQLPLDSDGDKDAPPPDHGIDTSPEEASNSQLWLSIADVFHRSWFWRVWVIQEAVLAKDAVVKWGNVEIDWRWVGLSAAIIRSNYHGICEAMQMGGVYNAYLIFRMSRLSDLPPLQVTFPHLLKLTRQFETTDPRDRVYGLLGMKSGGNEPDSGRLFITPDYTISAGELWVRLARQVIQSSQNLSILSSVQSTYGGAQSEDATRDPPDDSDDEGSGRLPSWVPNWQFVYRTSLTAWDADDSFTAAKMLPLQLTAQPESAPRILGVQGIKIGTVGCVHEHLWHDEDTIPLAWEHLGPFFASEAGFRLLARTYTAGRNAYGSLTAPTDEHAMCDFAAYIRSLYEKDARLDDEGREHYSWLRITGRYGALQAWASLPSLFKMHPGLKERLENWGRRGDANRFAETAYAVCKRRRLFLTVNGFLGIGPDTVQEGDLVTVLSGGDVPFLLRPIAHTDYSDVSALECLSTDAPLIQGYLLVGECFVEGLMQGEAVQALDRDLPFTGPIPTGLVAQKILTFVNLPVDDFNDASWDESEWTEAKKKEGPKRHIFTVEILEHHKSARLRKESFAIW